MRGDQLPRQGRRWSGILVNRVAEGGICSCFFDSLGLRFLLALLILFRSLANASMALEVPRNLFVIRRWAREWFVLIQGSEGC
jgi:hypothetical protein